MNFRKVLLFFASVLAIAGFCIYFLRHTDGPEERPTSEQAKRAEVEKKSVRKPAAAMAPPLKGSDKSDNKQIEENPEARKLYAQTLSRFADFERRREVAEWVAFGLFLSSDPGFGAKLQELIDELNRNPNRSIEAISNQVSGLGPSDAFQRRMLLNLVFNLDADPGVKIEFFGSQTAQKLFFDVNGDLSADSMNTSDAIDYLSRQPSVSDQTVIKFAQQALDANSGDERAQDNIVHRYAAHFPSLESQLLSLNKQ